MKKYHHGNLRAAALGTVDEVIREQGVQAVTLRDLGARLGVSHASFVHHFGSRAGVLTAFAVEGHELLQAAMTAPEVRSFLDVGVAYVAFAVDHPAHFTVMFSPSLLETADPALTEARERSLSSLVGGAQAQTGSDPARARTEALAAWSLMHGMSSLHVSGVLQQGSLVAVDDAEELLRLARQAGGMLFGG